jgi:hypothetical protein
MARQEDAVGADSSAANSTVSVVEGISQGSTQLLEMRSATTASWNCMQVSVKGCYRKGDERHAVDPID